MGLIQPTPIGVLIAIWLIDAVFGDPDYRAHPVRLLGGWSLLCERWLFGAGWAGRTGGLVHWLLVVGMALGVWGLGRAGLGWIDPRFAILWDLFIGYSLICTRDLLDHGRRVLDKLSDLPEARQALSRLVGRDTEPLGRAGIVRATIESLAENLTDAVLTPFWALCLFGLPGLVLVKAISTLDSMVGYRNDRYRDFGWWAARSDDLIHWLPARLSAPLIAAAALLRRTFGQPCYPGLALTTAWREHGALPSPNSGWSEAAVAGALRVRLLGPIYKRGALVNERFFGDPDWPADLDGRDLRRALDLVGAAATMACALGILMVWLL